MPKCNWMSGTSRSGRVLRNPPHSAKLEVIGSAAFAPVLHDGAKLMHDATERHAGEIWAVGQVGEDEIRMVLQILPDAGQVLRGRDAVLGQCCVTDDSGEHRELRGLERA